MFNSCTIHSVQINLNRPQDAKKVNFKKFFQLCVSLFFDCCRFFLFLVIIGCHPNFEPITFKLAHIKRKLMLINENLRSFLFSDKLLSLRGRFYSIKEIKNLFLVYC